MLWCFSFSIFFSFFMKMCGIQLYFCRQFFFYATATGRFGSTGYSHNHSPRWPCWQIIKTDSVFTSLPPLYSACTESWATICFMTGKMRERGTRSGPPAAASAGIRVIRDRGKVRLYERGRKHLKTGLKLRAF